MRQLRMLREASQSIAPDVAFANVPVATTRELYGARESLK